MNCANSQRHQIVQDGARAARLTANPDDVVHWQAGLNRGLLPGGVEFHRPDPPGRATDLEQDMPRVTPERVRHLVLPGIEQELAKKIVKLIKDSKMKVQGSIQGDVVRVSGAKKDLLQDAIALIRKSITDFPLQFKNFRD